MAPQLADAWGWVNPKAIEDLTVSVRCTYSISAALMILTMKLLLDL